MKKRILTLILATAFVTTSLIGCGSKNDNNEQEENITDDTSVDEVDEEEYSEEISEEEIVEEIPEEIPEEEAIVDFSTVAVGDIVNFGMVDYERDDVTQMLPFEWEVIAVESDKVLLLSHYVIDIEPYTSDISIGDTNWETSTIRARLNDELYNRWFNDNEKSYILDTTISNGSSKEFFETCYPDKKFEENTNPCGDTTDKLFLLSVDELMQYFGEVEYGDPHDWTYDCPYISSVTTSFCGGTTGTGWWLRNSGRNGTMALYVTMTAGVISDATADTGTQGLRPAMYVKY